MAKLKRTTIARRTVERLSVDKDTVFWGRALQGFGVRVYASGTKVYVVQTRAGGRSRRVKVGRHGVITPEQARQRAALIIARIKSGKEAVAPSARAPAGPTVAELVERYLREHEDVRCKVSTAKATRGVLNNHILPEFGKDSIHAVGADRISALHANLHRVPSRANQVVYTLSAMFNLAETWGLLPEGMNPCRQVAKYKVRRRERFLTEAEFNRLGRVLNEAEEQGEVSTHAAAAMRLLMLTGCRCNEILGLRWDEVDPEHAGIGYLTSFFK